MSMPETTMHEDHGLASGEDKVGATGQIARQPVSKPGAMKSTANGKFRLRIATANPGHHPAARGLVDDVSH
jgi:hypothetical protein